MVHILLREETGKEGKYQARIQEKREGGDEDERRLLSSLSLFFFLFPPDSSILASQLRFSLFLSCTVHVPYLGEKTRDAPFPT